MSKRSSHGQQQHNRPQQQHHQHHQPRLRVLSKPKSIRLKSKFSTFTSQLQPQSKQQQQQQQFILSKKLQPISKQINNKRSPRSPPHLDNDSNQQLFDPLTMMPILSSSSSLPSSLTDDGNELNDKLYLYDTILPLRYHHHHHHCLTSFRSSSSTSFRSSSLRPLSLVSSKSFRSTSIQYSLEDVSHSPSLVSDLDYIDIPDEKVEKFKNRINIKFKNNQQTFLGFAQIAELFQLTRSRFYAFITTNKTFFRELFQQQVLKIKPDLNDAKKIDEIFEFFVKHYLCSDLLANHLHHKYGFTALQLSALFSNIFPGGLSQTDTDAINKLEIQSQVNKHYYAKLKESFRSAYAVAFKCDAATKHYDIKHNPKLEESFRSAYAVAFKCDAATIPTMSIMKPIFRQQLQYLGHHFNKPSFTDPYQQIGLKPLDWGVAKNDSLQQTNKSLEQLNTFLSSLPCYVHQFDDTNIKLSLTSRSTSPQMNQLSFSIPKFKTFSQIEKSTVFSTPQQLILEFGILFATIQRYCQVDFNALHSNERVPQVVDHITSFGQLLDWDNDKYGDLYNILQICFNLTFMNGLNSDKNNLSVPSKSIVFAPAGIGKSFALFYCMQILTYLLIPWIFLNQNILDGGAVSECVVAFQPHLENPFPRNNYDFEPARDSHPRTICFAEKDDKAFESPELVFNSIPLDPDQSLFLVALSVDFDSKAGEVLENKNWLAIKGLYPYLFSPSIQNYSQDLIQHYVLKQFINQSVNKMDKENLSNFNQFINNPTLEPLLTELTTSKFILPQIPYHRPEKPYHRPLFYFEPRTMGTIKQNSSLSSSNNNSIISGPRTLRSANQSLSLSIQDFNDIIHDLSILHYNYIPSMRGINLGLKCSKKQSSGDNFLISLGDRQFFLNKYIPPSIHVSSMNPAPQIPLSKEFFPLLNDIVVAEMEIKSSKQTTSAAFKWWFINSILTNLPHFDTYLPFHGFHDVPVRKIHAMKGLKTEPTNTFNLFSSLPLQNSHLINYSHTDFDTFISNWFDRPSPPDNFLDVFIPKNGNRGCDFYLLQCKNQVKSVAAVQFGASIAAGTHDPSKDWVASRPNIYFHLDPANPSLPPTIFTNLNNPALSRTEFDQIVAAVDTFKSQVPDSFIPSYSLMQETLENLPNIYNMTSLHKGLKTQAEKVYAANTRLELRNAINSALNIFVQPPYRYKYFYATNAYCPFRAEDDQVQQYFLTEPQYRLK